jgi:hypothetical protein
VASQEGLGFVEVVHLLGLAFKYVDLRSQLNMSSVYLHSVVTEIYKQDMAEPHKTLTYSRPV